MENMENDGETGHRSSSGRKFGRAAADGKASKSSSMLCGSKLEGPKTGDTAISWLDRPKNRLQVPQNDSKQALFEVKRGETLMQRAWDTYEGR